MKQRCPGPNCPAVVPREVFMCARHWRMVPRQLRDDLRRAWQDHSTEAHGGFALEAIRVVTATEGGRTAAGVEPGTKALTIWQPWATLVVLGAKPYEFRKWNFADKPHLAKLIGRRVVIHAGARKPKEDELRDVLCRIEEGESALVPHIAKPIIEAGLGGTPFPLSAALGTAILGEPKNCFDLFVDKVADSDRIDQHMYAWPLSDIQPFASPIPAAGAQGFWNWS